MLDVDLTFSRPGFSLSANFTLRSGGISVLRGDSGSGKTTLANLLSGAIAPQKGRIVSDDDVWFDSDSRINVPTQSRGIGFVIQTHRLFSNLTVEETIPFPVLFGKRKPLLAFDELVELLSIEKLLERRPQILSGLLLGVSRASGEVGITMMVGGNLSGKTNTLSLEIFNAVSRADFDAAAALCLVLSIFTILIFAVLEGLRRRTPSE